MHSLARVLKGRHGPLSCVSVVAILSVSPAPLSPSSLCFHSPPPLPCPGHQVTSPVRRAGAAVSVPRHSSFRAWAPKHNHRSLFQRTAVPLDAARAELLTRSARRTGTVRPRPAERPPWLQLSPEPGKRRARPSPRLDTGRWASECASQRCRARGRGRGRPPPAAPARGAAAWPSVPVSPPCLHPDAGLRTTFVNLCARLRAVGAAMPRSG